MHVWFPWRYGDMMLFHFFIEPGPGVGPEEENGPCSRGVQPGQTHCDVLQFPEAAIGGPHVPDGRAAGGS